MRQSVRADAPKEANQGDDPIVVQYPSSDTGNGGDVDLPAGPTDNRRKQ